MYREIQQILIVFEVYKIISILRGAFIYIQMSQKCDIRTFFWKYAL